jgi:putative ABC transport system permease protein
MVCAFSITRATGLPLCNTDKIFNEKNMLAADGSFFNMFSFNFIKGDATRALADPSSIVITQSTAKKYFGSDDAIGKILKVDDTHNLMVTGVIEDVPAYSQIKFDMIANSAIVNGIKEYNGLGEQLLLLFIESRC